MTGNEETKNLNNGEKPEKSTRKKRNRKALKAKAVAIIETGVEPPKTNDKEPEVITVCENTASLDSQVSGITVVVCDTDSAVALEGNVNNENEEQVAQVTELFRSMIGIGSDKKSNVVRQFACKTCYRSWWRRVRLRKQVSKCIRCKVKYEAISGDEEFGIGEFKCTICNHEFKTWSQKHSTAVCKTCNAQCSPLKILPASKKNKVNTVTNSATSVFRPNTSYCQQCFGTCIDLNSNIIFRPQNYSYFEFVTPISTNKKGTSFCPACRKIPVFSMTHVSTGSTLPSVSYQDDLEQRDYEDDDQALETCVEEEVESMNA